MYILPINNYNVKNNGYRNSSVANFRGALCDKEADYVLSMLKDKVSKVKLCNSVKDIGYIVDELINKYKSKGVTCVGAMVIPDGSLQSFIADKVPYENRWGKKGFCIAVGDKNSAIETWDKVYDAVLALLPKHALD